MSAIESALLPGVGYRLGWTLLHFVWQGVVAAALLAVVLMLLRRRSANARYLVGCAALLVMAAIPCVTFLLMPAGPVPSAVNPATISGQARPTVEPAGRATHPPALEADTHETSGQARAGGNLAESASALRERTIALLEGHLVVVVLIWLGGVFALSFRHLTGWVLVQRVRRRATESVPRYWREALGTLSHRLGVRRHVRLLTSGLAEVPAVVGWLRPVVLLPASALTGLTPQQLTSIITHELAHIRRHDYLVNLVQTVIETMLFYHPAVWWVSHRICVEREYCCDDLAVSVSDNAVTYARALAELEQGRVVAAPLAVAISGGSLLDRIRRLVGRPASPTRYSFRWTAGAFSVAIVFVIASAALISARAETAEPPPFDSSTAKKLGVVRVEGDRTGTVAAKLGARLVQIAPGSTSKGLVGSLEPGAKIELEDPNVVTRQGGMPVVKVKVLTGGLGASKGTVGWILLASTSFAKCFEPIKDKTAAPPRIIGVIGEGSAKGTVISEDACLYTGGEIRFAPESILHFLDQGAEIELQDPNVPIGEHKIPVVKVKVLNAGLFIGDGAIGWIILKETSFVERFVPKDSPSDSGEAEPAVGVIRMGEDRTGTVTAKHITSLDGGQRRYSSYLNLGALRSGARLELQDPKVAKQEHGIPIVKVKVLDGRFDIPSGTVGWVVLSDTSFAERFDGRLGPAGKRDAAPSVGVIRADVGSIGSVTAIHGSSMDGSDVGYSPQLYLGGVAKGAKIQLLDQHAQSSEFDRPIIKVKLLDGSTTPSVGAIGWIDLAGTSFFDRFDDDPDGSSRPLRVVGVIAEGTREGAITANFGGAIYGSDVRYTPGLYLGRTSKGTKLRLLDPSVVSDKRDEPVVKIKLLDGTPTVPAETIGWVPLKDTSFSRRFARSSRPAASRPKSDGGPSQ